MGGHFPNGRPEHTYRKISSREERILTAKARSRRPEPIARGLPAGQLNNKPLFSHYITQAGRRRVPGRGVAQ